MGDLKLENVRIAELILGIKLASALFGQNK